MKPSTPPHVPTARFGSVAAALAAAALFSASPSAFAQSTIRTPGDRPPYSFEAEPHANLGFSPPGFGNGSGYGLGFRGSVEIVKNGFVPSINNSVAIGFGGDYLHYPGNGFVTSGICNRYVAGPNGTSVCVDVSHAGAATNYLFFPVVMQWNFWLTPQWSVFGEPGLALYWNNVNSLSATPALYVGGRWHFSKTAALTFRIGYPTVSIGVSFLL